MSRLTNRILLAALLGLFLTAPGIVRSQGFNARTLQRAQQRGETGNLYGTNPYEQTGEEGEEGQDGQPQDTTKKERRIRKPLESYFFSDSIRALNNFRWSVKRDYNRVEISPLDTHRLAHRLPLLPRGGGRHRAGRPRADIAADELFPAAAVL